jgi:hypothetical protein
MAKQYSYSILAEASCCMWEAVCEWRLQRLKPSSERFDVMMERIGVERVGTVEARHICIDLAETCCLAWDALSDEEHHWLIPYDWEFCPTFLLCVDWERWDGATIKGQAFEELVQRLKDAASVEETRQRAKEEARR